MPSGHETLFLKLLAFDDLQDHMQSNDTSLTEWAYEQDDDPTTEMLDTGSVTITAFGRTFELILNVKEISSVQGN